MDKSLTFRLAHLVVVIAFTLFSVGMLILTLPLCFWCSDKIHIRIRRFFMHLWARSVSSGLGIKIRVNGSRPDLDSRGLFVISNHMGPLDILVLAAVMPMAFVSRHDVAQWPFVGIMARSGGTIFANRKLKNTTGALVNEIAAHLKLGDNVLVFPEGTSSNGEKLLPFKSSVFEAPVMTRSPILPINLSYVSINGKPFTPQTRDHVCWYGEMEFIPYIWELLGSHGIRVDITFNPTFLPGPTRKETAIIAHNRVKKNFRPILPVADEKHPL